MLTAFLLQTFWVVLLPQQNLHFLVKLSSIHVNKRIPRFYHQSSVPKLKERIVKDVVLSVW